MRSARRAHDSCCPARIQTKPANPKLIARGVKRLLPRFLAHKIDAFTPHDLRRTGRTTLGRLGVTPFIAERVIKHSKDDLEETYDLWDYFDEKRDALERLEKYLSGLVAIHGEERKPNVSVAAKARARNANGGTASLRVAGSGSKAKVVSHG